VLEALRLEPLDSPAGVSQLRVGITQAAASSLAATFSALHVPADADPSAAIPVLGQGLRRWTLRKRFIEALAMYQDPRALAEILGFAREELSAGGDAGIFGALAAAIGVLAENVDNGQHAEAVAVLDEIAAIGDLDRKTTRTVRTSLARLQQRTDSIPEVTDDEILEGLNPSTYSGAYSDWVDAKEAAYQAYRRILTGLYPAELVTALVHAFGHPITAVRPTVAQCLGRIDDPRARAALLAEVLKPDQPNESRQACLTALAEQIRLAPSPAQAAVRRWEVLDAAAIIARSGRTDIELAALAQPSPGDARVTAGAIEVLRLPAAATWTEVNAILEDAPDQAVERPVTIEPADTLAVGRDFEPKYRIRQADLDERGNLRLRLVRASWTEGAAFHRALLRRGFGSTQDQDRLLAGIVDGSVEVPGVASVHCIVVTADGQVLCSRRPDAALYSPGRWSVSFEEQLTAVDFVDGVDPVRAAALRGLAEELGVGSFLASVDIHATLLEMPILNQCVLAIIRSAATAADIRTAWRENTSDEANAIEFIAATAETLQTEAQRSDLQPTSAIRMLTLADTIAATNRLSS
jgi:hypothetical protein